MNTNEELKTNMNDTDNTSSEIDSPKNGASNSSRGTPHNKAVGHIISVIAFAMAIVSFVTTKRGMQQYIFEGVLGGLVSFGVQAMLFSLSMTIPRYWSVMRNIGRIVMIVLLCALMAISSGFTYVYAVDHVYGSTKFINSGNSVVRLHSAELKEAREYVDNAMKYYRLEMSNTISRIQGELDDSDSAKPNESATPTAMPDVTPIPENIIPAEISIPKPYPSGKPDEDWMPSAVFFDYHDYPDTNITVIVVANMDEKGNIIENTIKAKPFDNQPATVAECTNKINEIELYIEEYENKRDDQKKYANDEATQSSGTPRDEKINRYQANAEAYDKVVSKLKQIKSNIELTKESIEGTIDNKANGLLAEMLKEQNATNIIGKVNELKDFIMQKQAMLSNDKFVRIVDLLQQISIIADDYKLLTEIKGNLDEIDSDTDYSGYLGKTVSAQEVANATATPEATATATPEPNATATREPTSTAIPEATATATPIEEWEGDSNEMLIELAAEIRRIPSIAIFADSNVEPSADSSAAPSVDSTVEPSSDSSMDKELQEMLAKYNPIEHADKLQDMIRNEITNISPIEKAFRRLSGKYSELALGTLIVAFVCDLTALGAGFVNNNLAVYNLNLKRAAFKAAIKDIKETCKGERKLKKWKDKRCH